MKTSDVRSIQKELTRLATLVEAAEVFEGSDYERRVFERQVKQSVAAFAAALESAGVSSVAKKRTFKTTPIVKKWRSERMKLFAQTQKHAKGTAEHTAAADAYAAWMAANPAPSKK